MTVFVILTTGNDYYDSEEFHSIYATREAAMAKATELRAQTSEFTPEELEYTQVKVIEQEVLG